MTRISLIAVILVALLDASCSDGDHGGEVNLSWRLADGRDCSTSGIVTVIVSGASANASQFRCTEGITPSGEVSLYIKNFPTHLELEGRSISDVVLYSGAQDVETRGSQTVTLIFTGAP